ncbi:MAG: sulfate adenylyltransferase subunit 1 [Flavobacteriaceae bacterium]
MELFRIATAGSVDDGKSTLIGRLLYETQSLKEDQLQHIEQKSKARGFDYLDFSLATDGLLTEREQGITIDVSHIFFKTAKRRFIIADSPGHIEYTRNMVTGASTANAAILLLDARKGVVEQTLRHFFVTNLLALDHLIFAINKMDLIDYDQATFEAIVAEIKSLLAQQKKPPTSVQFIPISALKGDNITEKSDATKWYTGHPLITIIENLPLHAKPLKENVLQVQYVIRPQQASHHDYRGFAGKVKSGHFKRGDSVVLAPSGQQTTIERIEKYGSEVSEVQTGENATFILSNAVDASRGSFIHTTNTAMQPTSQVAAKLCWMQPESLVPQQKYWLQNGVTTVLTKVETIGEKINFETQTEEKANALHCNDIGSARLRLAQPLLSLPYAQNKKLGAFILIDPQTHNTAGVGFFQ